MRKFWLGVLTGLGVPALAFGIVVVSGATPIAAVWLRDCGWLKSFLAYTTRRAIQTSAPAATNPVAGDLASMRKGMKEFDEDCLHCHGSPDQKRDKWAEGLIPEPPAPTSERMQTLTDSQMFWVIRHGIHSTGMPSFKEMKEEEVWSVVSYLRATPNLPPELKQKQSREQKQESSE